MTPTAATRLALASVWVSAVGGLRSAHPRRHTLPTPPQRTAAAIAMATSSASASADDDYDVVVIGAGLGGLSAAALLASRGLKVAVCESHDTAGGAAHSWKVKGYTFESGPSLYAGLSPDRSPNPLKHVFQMIGEEPEWLTYSRWGTYLPEGSFAAAVGASDFVEKLKTYRSEPDATEQWQRLMRRVTPLGEAIFALPSAAVRADAGAILTLGRYLPALAKVLALGGASLQAPFSRILEEERVTDPFILNWLNMICFLLQGTTVDKAPTTLMAYMLSDFYREGVSLDFPKGGTDSIVEALVRGLTKQPGCILSLNTHVDSLLVEGKRASGVRLRGGRTLRARSAVISNADLWSTRKLVDKVQKNTNLNHLPLRSQPLANPHPPYPNPLYPTRLPTRLPHTTTPNPCPTLLPHPPPLPPTHPHYPSPRRGPFERLTPVPNDAAASRRE